MSYLIVMLMAVFFMVVIVSWYRLGIGSDGSGDACRPEEVLAALCWEIKGTYASGRFVGSHKDRKVEITIQAGHYRISVEGVPEAGDLEGREAVARIKELSRSVSGSRDLAAVPDWEAIVRVFDAHPFRFEGGQLISTASFGGGVLGANEEATRLRRLLDRLVEVTKVAQVALSLRSRVGQEHTHCPYCHEDFGGDLPTTECPKCLARHHVDCFAEHGRCAVFACSAHVPQGLRDLSGPGKPSGGSIRSV